MDNAPEIWKHVDDNAPELIALSDRVWGMPETCYQEARSCAEHTAELKRQGFRITENVAGIPTAVMGEAGEGGPVIAFLGEYDALPDLSQEAGVAEPRPLEKGANGHGCGHNMLGSAAMLAAMGAHDENLEHVEIRESLKPLLDGLDPREKRILLLRFFKNMTQSQIATEIGVSQMHVSRLLTRTLDQLRSSLQD